MPKISAPIKKVLRGARRSRPRRPAARGAREPGSAGRREGEPGRLRPGRGDLPDDREGDGAAGGSESGARRAGRRRTRWTRSRRSSTTASVCSRRARSRRRTSTMRRSTSVRRAISTRSRESASRTCRASATTRRSRRRRRSVTRPGRATRPRRRSSAMPRITSPIDGVVTDRPLYAGETVASGSPIITVMDLSQIVARAHIAPSEAAELKVGDDANLIGPDGAPVPGKVTQISPGARRVEHDRRSVGSGRQPGRTPEAGVEPPRGDDRHGPCRARWSFPRPRC